MTSLPVLLPPNSTVLVLDGETRAALAVVRDLGRMGLRVLVGAQQPGSLAASSRYCAGEVVYKPPSQPEAFCESMLGLVAGHAPAMLLPITDMSVHAVLLNTDKFADKVKLPLPTLATYWAASDKCSLVKTALEIGVACPKTEFFAHAQEALVMADALHFPAVLKPRASLLVTGDMVVKTNVRFANNRVELEQILRSEPAFNAPFMVQERLQGEGLGIFALCKNGETLAIFSHKRIREKPPWGGVSVVCERTVPDNIAQENACKLLKKINWTGVAMVEFKRDHRSGIPMLMEINGRFWGSLQLAIDAGVHFPRMLYELANNGNMAINISCKKARSRWLLGDADNLFITLKMPVPFLKKGVAIGAFIAEFFKGSKIEEFRYGDVGVFWYALKKWARGE